MGPPEHGQDLAPELLSLAAPLAALLSFCFPATPAGAMVSPTISFANGRVSGTWLPLSPPAHRATQSGHSFAHAALACETSNFQHDMVSLQGLVGATIFHSAMHPMLLPTWGAGPPQGTGPPLGHRGAWSSPQGWQPRQLFIPAGA